MTKTKSRLLMALLALVLTVSLFFGIGGGFLSGLTANAAEENPHESGWYITGNGAGFLQDCSWLQYVDAYRIEGEALDKENYTGVWTTPEMLLYETDQFKLLYNNGTYSTPLESGWGYDIQAQFMNIVDNTAVDFIDGGLGNIQALKSGYYTFTLYVDRDVETQEVKIDLEYERSDKEVPDISLYDMYVIGSIAVNPACGWPDDGVNVANDCIKMTYNPLTDKWTAQVTLIPNDSFKVYNLITGDYYPMFYGTVYTGYDGEYVIEWATNAHDIYVIPAEEYPFL